MMVSDKLSYVLVIFLLIPGMDGLCQQGNACEGIVNGRDKITCVLQIGLGDSIISSSLYMELVRELKKPITLKLYVEEYDHPASEKDTLGILSHISPYELRDGMDILFQFSENDSILIDGKQTLENMEPLYKRQLEELSLFSCNPPPRYPRSTRSTVFLAYNIPLNENDVALFQSKNLEDIVIKNSNIRFSISRDQAIQLKILVNCLITNKPGQ